jgi:hypothetical protein
MKKNLYNIMDETNEKELGTLIDGIEYDENCEFSAENISKKVYYKRKRDKNRIRAAIIRFGAAAACIALIISMYPTVKYFAGSENTNGANIQTELGIAEISPSIAYADSISYDYFFPLQDGSVLCEPIFFKLHDGKMKETWKELLAPFFGHCDINVTVSNWNLTTSGESTVDNGNGTVTHTLGVKTLTIYLTGPHDLVLDDHTLKCLVNTIDSITYAKYIKLEYNGAPVSIEGKCPAEGFTNFHIDTLG